MANKLWTWLVALSLCAPMSIAMAADISIAVRVTDPTVVALSSSKNPSVVGDAVSFQATVTASLGASVPTPTGTVTFFIDGAAQSPNVTLNASGVASLSTNALAIGDHVIRVHYNGDGEGDPSTSADLTQTVSPAIPVISVAATHDTANEAGTVHGSMTISRSGSTAAALNVIFVISGSATEDTDYNAIGTSATIPAGASSVIIDIAAKQDDVHEGDETVILTLSNNAAYALGNSSSAKITILDDDAFAISSALTATPNPAIVQQAVQFTVGTNGADVTYTWAFGDGTSVTGTSATVSHTYALPLVANVTVSALAPGGARVNAQLSLNVLAAGTAPPPSPDLDTDGDGISDEMELALGTDPLNPQSCPVTNAVNPLPLNAAKMAIALNFKTKGNDGFSLSGTLPVTAGFSFAGQKVGVDVGGVVRTFTLNAKGKAKVGFNSMAIGIKPKAGVSKFTVRVSKGTFADKLEDEKMTNATVKKSPVSVVVKLIFNNLLYQKTQPQSYSATQGKTGRSK